MNSLEDMEAQAQRHLDGCRVNVDRMALNQLELVRQVRALQQQVHGLRQQLPGQAPAGAEPKQYRSAKEAIDEMLRGAGMA